MIRTIIIDDEPNNVANLQALLHSHCEEIDIIATAYDAIKGKEFIIKHQPDLIFLDIQMPEQNGFELLASLPNRNFEVIFVTAFDQYGINAVKFAAIDYLLKPINTEELKTAVSKVLLKKNHQLQSLKLENLIQLIEKNNQKQEHRIALSSAKETRFIVTGQIIRCESANNYTTFYLSTKEEIVVSKPIYEYEEMLADYGFIRCHQSHLINKKHIKSVVKTEGGYILMEDSTSIPISRQKRELISKMLSL